jgi:branched-chain amino acid transport system permease protein
MMDAGAGGSVLMMTLLGGLGTLWGPFVGAGVFIFAQDYISTMTEHWMIFLGLLLIVLVLFIPKGIAGFREAIFREKSE